MKLHWLLLAMVPACMQEGDRAVTGQCPAGLTCSPETPNGLLFQGTSFADSFFTVNGPEVTAIGGTQQIGLFLNETNQPALTLPYSARATAGVEVTSQTGSTIEVKGMATAQAELQIFDPEGELYDETAVSTAALDRISLLRADGVVLPDGEQVVWASAPVNLAIALLGRTAGQTVESRLVDTSMTIDTALDTEQTKWDELDIIEPPSEGDHEITVTAGNAGAMSIVYTVVDHADAIEVRDDSTALSPGVTAMYCYAATNNARFIAGATWTATTTNGTIGAFVDDGCFAVAPDHAGAVHVTLSALDASASFDYTAATARLAPVKPAPPRAHAMQPRSMLGERAALSPQ
ncbi:MAG TPA: hypothetical protein VGM88_25205 [Kofleriaceae bacterium]|jgi:hypothetical protein